MENGRMQRVRSLAAGQTGYGLRQQLAERQKRNVYLYVADYVS